MPKRRSSRKHIDDSESEEELKTKRTFAVKTVNLNLSSSTSIPYERLDQQNQIRNFFCSPVPYFYGRELDGSELI